MDFTDYFPTDKHQCFFTTTPPPPIPFSPPLFSVGPLVLVELGVVVRFAVLHSDAARQDRGHVVAHGLPLCLLLPLLLHLPQLDAWRGDGGGVEDGGRREGGRRTGEGGRGVQGCD